MLLILATQALFVVVDDYLLVQLAEIDVVHSLLLDLGHRYRHISRVVVIF